MILRRKNRFLCRHEKLSGIVRTWS